MFQVRIELAVGFYNAASPERCVLVKSIGKWPEAFTTTICSSNHSLARRWQAWRKRDESTSVHHEPRLKELRPFVLGEGNASNFV